MTRRTAHSLYTRLMTYFDANPEEELSRGDIATKFSVCLKSVDEVLKTARQEGRLEAIHAHRLTGRERARVTAQAQA